MVVSYPQIVLKQIIAPEMAAAIAAALAAYMPEETGWQITGIRPLDRPNRWVRAGRQELMRGALLWERRRMAG